MVLSPADIASIQGTLTQFLPQAQSLASDLLPDTCLLYRDTQAPDAVGQIVTTPDPSPRTVACRVAPTGSGDREKTVSERNITINPWEFAFPAQTDVLKTDRIVYDGATFEILAVQGSRSFEVERIVIARRLPL